MHRRWVRGFRKFRAVTERVCCVDVNIMLHRFRFIAVYMPHSGYDDSEVEGAYVTLSELVTQGKREHRTCVLIGDYNAIVGSSQAGDDDGILGAYGVGSRNARGEWLLQWAAFHQLVIANTVFPKGFEDQWTHQRGDVKRQIDYCLISGEKVSMITDAKACDDVNVGMDHRAVGITIEIKTCKTHSMRRTRQLRGWTPIDQGVYQKEVDEGLRDLRSNEALGSRPEAEYRQIEKVLVDVGNHCMTTSSSKKTDDREDEPRMRTLIEERKLAKRTGNKMRVKEVSKAIQKEMKASKIQRRTAKVTKVLEEYKDLKRLAEIRCEGQVQFITSMTDKDGSEKNDREDIANVFADFFEALYADTETVQPSDEVLAEVPDVQIEELKEQLKHMKPRKAADDGGVVAELLKSSSVETLRIIAKLFTATMKPGAVIPESWKKSSIRVLFKKGDSRQPENYRPICIIPVLYKLFSKVIAGRIKDILNSQQSTDQAGFRPDFSCDDNLFTLTLLAEKCKEFNVPLWVATLDFKKAFDSIHHKSILESLAAHGVAPTYVDLIKRLYEGQSAKVWCECFSREFKIRKGTKQGDPISSLLFNSVLEEVMRKVKLKWKSKNYGIRLGYTTTSTLTNLRFADDIVLTARSLPQIKQMLADVVEQSAEVGLELHPEKTKIQHNNIGYGSRVQQAQIKGMQVQVLQPDAHTIYLGKALNLIDTHEVELKHRLRKAWAKFGMLKTELTDQAVPLRLRLRLFHAVVTPSVLYGCASWVLTDSRERLLRSAQRRMIRWMMGKKRRLGADGQLELWPEYIKRATHFALTAMQDNNIEDWAKIHIKHKEKWRLQLEDMDADRWARRAYQWMPEGCRSQGRPKSRWEAKV